MTVELNEDILHKAGIGNFFRPSQLEPLGISYHRLRQLEADEAVERVGWGLYRLADAEPTERYSIASICARVPNSIRLPPIGPPGAWGWHPAPAPGMDRHSTQGEASYAGRRKR